MTDLEKGANRFINELDNHDIRIRRKAANKLGEFKKEEAVDPLIKHLTDKDETLKKSIIRALQRIGSNKAIIPLLKLYKEESSIKVKALIAQTLAYFIYDDFNMSILLNDLGDNNDYLRLKIIYALGNKKFKKGVPKLIELLANDKNIEIRKMAAWALGYIEDRKALEPLIEALGDKSHKVRRRVGTTLVEFPYTKLKIREILGILEQKDHPGKTNSIHVLGKLMYYNSVPKLTELLENSEDFRIRKKVVWALGRLKDARALQTLAKAMKDPSKSVRAQVANAFSYHPNIDTKIINCLLDLLADDYYLVRMNVLKVLWDIAGTLSVPNEIYLRLSEIIDLLNNDPDERVREKAANFFYILRDKRTVTALRKALQDPSGNVRAIAAKALIQLKEKVDIGQFIDALNDPSLDNVRSAYSVLYRHPKTKNYREVLLQILTYKDHKARQYVLYIISETKILGAIPILVDMIKNEEDSKLRDLAVWTISKYQGEEVLDTILYALNDSSPQVRSSADWILQRKYPRVSYERPDLPEDFSIFGNKPKKRKKIVLTKETENDILKLLDILNINKNSIKRMKAAVALKKHIQDERVIQPLINALRDSSSRVRTSAAYTLGKVDNSMKIKPLISSLNDPSPKVRKTAAIALSRSADQFSEEKLLIDALKNEEHIGRESVASVIGRLVIKKGTPILIELLENEVDSIPRKAIVWAAYKLKDERILDALIDSLNNPNPGVRSAVLSCLLYVYKEIREKTDVLIELYKDKNHYGREQIIYLLGEIGCKECNKVVVSALFDSQYNVRRTAHVMLRMKMRGHLIPKDYDLLTRN